MKKQVDNSIFQWILLIFILKNGKKFFELSDHLGNVLATVSENPNTYTRSMYLSYLFVQDVNAAAVVEDFYYVADVKSYSDYMPFGMQMAGRHGSAGEYRYGFNGMEKDDEVFGSEGTSYTAEYWQYDSRLGRRWNIDPIDKPWESSYATFANNPIYYIDPNGDNAGDFYNKDGQHLGSDGNSDEKVYVADGVTKNDKGLVTDATNSQELGMTHSEFQKAANIVNHESSGNKEESLWIAHTANNAKDSPEHFGKHKNLYGQLTAKYNENSKYSSVSDNVKNTPLSVSNLSESANNARAAVIDVLTGGADPTGGAVLWDGTDLLSVGTRQNKFKEGNNILIHGDHFKNFKTGAQNYNGAKMSPTFNRSNVFLPANAKNGTSEGGPFTFRSDYGWMGGNFHARGKGKFNYETTGSQGASIFWKTYK